MRHQDIVNAIVSKLDPDFNGCFTSAQYVKEGGMGIYEAWKILKFWVELGNLRVACQIKRQVYYHKI